jgi:tetratricopeptide (TPR) repeat protein
MPNPNSQNRKVFEENIELLFEELELAIKWGRPSILLAVHKSKIGQDKACKALEEKLKKLGKNIIHIVVNQEHPDIPHTLLGTPAADQTIFFVSNIDWGGGNDGKEAYKALNIYRELFVENQIKVVFWLTPDEAANLPRYAPDFWAFRHRVIEFTAQRTLGKVTLPAGILIWPGQERIDSFDKPEQRIEAREEILAKLPQNNDSLSTRTELLYNLGYLYWFMGNSNKAAELLNTGLILATNHGLYRLRSMLLNGKAAIYYEAKQYEQALDFYNQAIIENPEENSLFINLSAACCAIGRNQEAITIGKRAIKMNASDAKTWNRLGYIYCAMTKFNEAVNCFTKAAELSPRSAIFQESLAVAFSLLERLDESMRLLGIARGLAGDQGIFRLDIYDEAISGNIDESLELLRNAFNANQISINEIHRDPDLNLLFLPSELELLSNQVS